MLEHKINEFFGDEEPSGFGTGWWSGVLSAFFGVLALGAVVCLHYPQLLTSPELRPFYPMHVMRIVIQCVILGAIVLGLVSAMLRRKKVLALTGMALALVATLFGGASVPINETLHAGPAIGLDWFLLDMLLMTLIFSPIEVLWPAYHKQSVFRDEWLLDIVYFLSTHLPIQVTSFLILLPATQLTKYLGIPAVLAAMGSLPWVVQVFLAILVADLCEYAIHRLFHTVPWLWRFHAIHHSSKALDWIAGSRSHLVDDVVVRGFMLVPMMFIFPHDIIVVYLFFVTIQRDVDALQLRSDAALAGTVRHPAALPPLAPQRRRKRRSTGTSPSTSRGSTASSARTICPGTARGRIPTACTTRPCRPGSGRRRSIRSVAASE